MIQPTSPRKNDSKEINCIYRAGEIEQADLCLQRTLLRNVDDGVMHAVVVSDKTVHPDNVLNYNVEAKYYDGRFYLAASLLILGIFNQEGHTAPHYDKLKVKATGRLV